MKKLEIEKTKPTFIISTFKTDIIIVGLVFSISNFFIKKMSLANIWTSFSCSNLALSRKSNWKYSFIDWISEKCRFDELLHYQKWQLITVQSAQWSVPIKLIHKLMPIKMTLIIFWLKRRVFLIKISLNWQFLAKNSLLI